MGKSANYPTVIDVDPTEMSATTLQYMELADWKPIDIQSAAEIEQRCNEYFQYCVQNNRRPIIQGLALALSTNRQSLINWEGEDSPRGRVIGKAKQIIRALVEDWTVSGRINAPCGIFILKNIAGYQDSVTLDVGRKEGFAAKLSPEEIAKQIEESIPVDTDYSEVPDNAD